MAGERKRAKAGRSSQVPGQLYGYSVQTTRAVAHLLRARPGQSVSVEHLDDVATESPASTIVEQDKSGLAHNPVADRCIDLWKTFHIWVSAIRDGALKHDARFILFVAQDHHGSVIDRIHAVSNQVDAAALVSALRNEFWGPAPGRALRAALPKELRVHVDAVLQASDAVLVRLFCSISLENGSGSPGDDLLLALSEKPISQKAHEDVIKHLLGWAKRAIDKRIEKGLPAILEWEEFNSQLIAAAQKFDRSDTILTSADGEVKAEEVRTELRGRLYVRQLEAVQCGEDDLVRAVNDYLRAAVDRTAWSERGDVVEGSFRDFEDGLQRAWKSQRTRVEIEQKAADEEDRGRLLYAQCAGLQLRLQGKDVPAYFVPGSFHSLAESLEVGWHPRFREVLFGGGQDPGSSPRDSAPDAAERPEGDDT
jgi:hypothetical protein